MTSAVVEAGVSLRVRWLGRLPYREAWDLQKAILGGQSHRAALSTDYLLLLEHPHTYTVGRNGDDSNLSIDHALLAGIGAEYHRVDRGGDITYHGPGPTRRLSDRVHSEASERLRHGGACAPPRTGTDRDAGRYRHRCVGGARLHRRLDGTQARLLR